MRILYLAPRPPFPPEGRETVRPYHQIRTLALHNDVDLICFSGGVDEWEARERLKKLCPRVQMIPLDAPPQEPKNLRNLLASRPLALRRYFKKDLLRRLETVAQAGTYDLVFVYSAAMASYLDAFPNIPKVIDLVDVGSLRWFEYSKLSRLPSAAVYRAEGARLMSVELRAARAAQRVVFASKAEVDAFSAICPDNPRLTALKTPVNPRAPLRASWAADPTILFTGHLDHFPNADAATRLLVDIFPRIKSLCPRAKLAVAGKNPSAEVRALCEHPDVHLATHPGDLPALFRDAWLMVAPHRVTRGVRNEVLEAMAAGVPVLATSAGAAGLDLLPRRDIMVESNEAKFAAEAASLLQDPGRLDELAERGRKSVHNNYSHWSTAIRLEEIINQATVESLEPVG